MRENETRPRMLQKTRRAIAGATFLATLAMGPGPAAAQFVEEDVRVLRQLEGEQVGDYFGWVGASIPDLDGDHVHEVLIPAIAYSGFSGRATLYSGATGAVINDIIGSPGQALGYSVAYAGDVNGDGVADYVIGGGAVRVYSGKDHSVIFDVSATTGFGSSVSGAGDVNHDGHDDIIVGSQTNSSAFSGAGRVFAFSGLDGSVLWTQDGAGEGHRFGSALGLVGDVNDDGIVDLSIGAAGAGPSGGGEAYVVNGHDGSTIHRLEPIDPAEASVFGEFFASGAGDVDGDRVPDVFVGDYAEGVDARAGTGRAYIFSGRTGDLVHVFTGFSPGDGLGPGRGIADVNGDRYNDVIVAAYLNSSGAPQAGAAYIFSGRSGALLRRITADVGGDFFGVDALSVGDVNGDRIPDFLVTAVGRSFAGVDVGRAYLIEGTRLPCPADLNGNRFVGPFDILRIRKAFGQNGGPADLNGDGVVDVQDFVVGVRDLGRCPRGVPRRLGRKCRVGRGFGASKGRCR